MKTAKDFNKKDNESLDNYITSYIYNQLDLGKNPASIYLNQLDLDNVNHKEFKDRLKELGFKVSNGIEGVDNIILIHI